jgi:hypothetical protein
VDERLTDSGDGGDDLSELELVEDGGLTGSIEPNHQNPHLLLGEEAAEQLREREPHLSLCHRTESKQGSVTSTQIRIDSLRSQRVTRCSPRACGRAIGARHTEIPPK